MAIKPIEWEGLSHAERSALVKAAEHSPLAFCSMWFNVTQGETFQTNWHHHYFDWAARKLLDGDSKALAINIPPGGTKTEFWSIHFPVYAMVKHAKARILNTSYSKDLVNENSTRSRSLVRSSEFREFYPWDVGKDRADDWTLERNGKRIHQLLSRSSDGQITGVRGGFMTDDYSGHVSADDWEKPSDMFSMAKRSRSHTRLVNTLRSRKARSDTPFLFIQQRLHADDSTAFLLSGGMGLTIDLHIKIPALINEEYIASLPEELRERCIRDVCSSEKVGGYWSYWPKKESIHDLIALREAHPYTFSSQYMQDPDTLDGGIFSADDFLYYGDTDAGADIETPDEFKYRFITVDTAQKTNTWNDWTVFAEWGVAGEHIYRLGYKRARMNATVLREEFEKFVKASWAKNSKEYGNLRKVMVEDKSSGTGLIQEMENRLPLKVTPVPRERDKLTRALDVQGFHAAKKVALPYGDIHNYEFVSEVASFTADDSHKHDDQTDVMIDALAEVYVTRKNTFAAC